jgi:alkanesulfonate monooxygenase SsuD/methylene tetrahydromethanopterin reductase-like flavin-dependent oxidoreductase (luciferase family)
VDAGLDARTATELAAVCEDLGYRSLWANDSPGAPGLETLGHFATGAPSVDLGVGVIPIDRCPPSSIVEQIDRLGLDPTRLWLGIGSGRLHPQIGPLRDAVLELRSLLPSMTRIVIAAMSPNLCRLGGAIADGVLLNWMVPDYATKARDWVREGARAESRDAPAAAMYIRVAVGPGAAQRLHDEESRYRTFSADHFEAMDAAAGSVGVAGAGRDEVTKALAPYRTAVDLPIARALAPSSDTLVDVARAAAP